ncbi:MAG TPA: glutamate-1-semialdehyde 2,1-aminomutase [Steroidobacteraceae bacterium]|nr:glutamate-1-semialdehyde 2,1-aminomutase [Steroidobacteraceae bacterium]
MNYRDRLLKVIPGGAHTYSRGHDQYPANAPQILASGAGAYVFDADGNRFLDYGMALRAVNLGYAEQEIDEAAWRQIRAGNNLTRPSLIELEAAELFVSLIDSVDMVKFTKNGSTSVSAAVKLARAFTGRELVARCAEHPFFSYDDWFIGSTPLTRGIPAETIEKTKLFGYNDVASLEALLERHPGQFACVVLEPAATQEPTDNFLGRVQALCRKHGAVFILDEMITGFRWHMKGAQHTYGVQADLCTFGKAMANGFSVSCVAGKREIMELGSIEFEGRERVFLLSTTHGAEMAGLGAFVASVNFMQRHDVVGHLWSYGTKLLALMARQAAAHGIAANFRAGGIPCSPYFATLDADGKVSLPLRTLFLQEMIRNGVLMPWIALSYRHGDAELALTERALDAAFHVYRKALENGVEKYLEGPVIKPVFRRFN